MTPIDQVQQLTRDTIAGAAFFSGWEAGDIIVDSGRANETEEAALRDAAKGRHITVLPIIDGTTVSQAGTAAVVVAGVAVKIAVNPELFSGNALELVRHVKTALLTYASLPKERFALADKCLALDLDETGLIAYLLFVEKPCVF